MHFLFDLENEHFSGNVNKHKGKQTSSHLIPKMKANEYILQIWGELFIFVQMSGKHNGEEKAGKPEHIPAAT
jgi:hypothetical protein